MGGDKETKEKEKKNKEKKGEREREREERDIRRVARAQEKYMECGAKKRHDDDHDDVYRHDTSIDRQNPIDLLYEPKTSLSI